MTPQEHDQAAARLRAAFELHDFGMRLMRQNLRRRHPDESEDQITDRLNQWLRSRPILWEGTPPQGDPESAGAAGD